MLKNLNIWWIKVGRNFSNALIGNWSRLHTFSLLEWSKLRNGVDNASVVSAFPLKQKSSRVCYQLWLECGGSGDDVNMGWDLVNVEIDLIRTPSEPQCWCYLSWIISPLPSASDLSCFRCVCLAFPRLLLFLLLSSTSVTSMLYAGDFFFFFLISVGWYPIAGNGQPKCAYRKLQTESYRKSP